MVSEKYNGEERREYCAQHCVVADTARKSVPRWVYIITMSAWVALAGIYLAWNSTIYEAVVIRLEGSVQAYSMRVLELEKYVDSYKIQSMQETEKAADRRNQAQERTNNVLEKLSTQLNQLSNDVMKFSTIQEVVLKENDRQNRDMERIDRELERLDRENSSKE